MSPEYTALLETSDLVTFENCVDWSNYLLQRHMGYDGFVPRRPRRWCKYNTIGNEQPNDDAIFVRQTSFYELPTDADFCICCFSWTGRAIPSSVMKWWDEMRSF